MLEKTPLSRESKHNRFMLMRLFLLFISLLVFLPVSVTAQINIKYNIKPVENPVSENLISDRLYPLGFSPNSLFAYISISTEDGKGCFVWRFVVVNLINDKTVRQIKWESEDLKSGGNFIDFNGQYKSHKEKILSILQTYKINTESIPVLQPFPLQTGKDNIVTGLIRGQPEEKDNITETSISLQVVSKKKGFKIIGSVKEVFMGIPLISNSKIKGFIKSPFEPRIVVIIEQEHRGFDGPPNIIRFKSFGSSINKGFK